MFGLLKPVDSSMFGVSPSRTGLLWGLECLAWKLQNGDGSTAWIGGMESSYGYGKVIGRISADGKKRWRVDWDSEKGIHINVDDFSNGKGDNAYKAYIPFEGNEDSFKSYIDMLNR